MNFLLEIGTEEIPHWMIPGALEQLEYRVKGALGHAALRTDATPRRLVLWATNIQQSASSQIVRGPAKSAPPGAIEGFARKHGVPIGELAVRQIAGGEYFSFIKTGSLIAEVLSVQLPNIILGITWPKEMYWKQKNESFVRPIRWIVALLDDQVISFGIAGVQSGKTTRGHRQLGSSSIPVTIENYESELRRNFVMLSSPERRHKIEKEASALGAKIDADLLETLTFITEYPTAIRGDFDPQFLELPAEVLTTVMRHHQKYFSVEAAPGMLAPQFVAVMNTSGDPDGLVKAGNERVLKARFNDAKFFWNVDQARKLADRVEDLKKVTFHVKLGSYFEKTERVAALTNELSKAHDQRAALLCKADLTTEMVKEFTDLQGVVGGLYARTQGEPEGVWRAIYEHYKPLSMDDSIPSTYEGRVLALADKLDTLRECFRIGIVPTGSKDPFALRRAAQGVVKILVEANFEWRLSDLVSGELYEFILDRARHYFREIRGYKYDEVNAAMAGAYDYLFELEEMLAALAEIRQTENFEPVAAGFTRIKNILKQANFTLPGSIDDALLEDGAERELYSEYQRLHALVPWLGFKGALQEFAALRPLVDRFFDKVLVNAPDPKVRANRLALLHALFTEFSTIADFSEIVTAGEQK